MSLPKGWAAATLADIATQRSGNGSLIKGRLSAVPGEGLFPAFSASGQDVWRDDYEYEGDAIIVSAVGARCGKAFRAKGKWSAVANTHIVRPEEEVTDVHFLYLILNNEDFWDKGGTAQPFVKVRTTFERSVNLPPITEQRRIVAKLDALTARLARARAELDRVPVLAANLRRATLSQAFSGALTTAKRSADETLREGGFPPHWQVRELGQISEIQGGIQVGKKRPEGSSLIETPYLRVANVQRGWLRLDEIKTLGITKTERDRLLLKSGDILMNEGGDRDKLGRGWVWRDQVTDCIHQNHVFRIRLSDKDFPPEFVSHYANEFGQRYFIDEGKQTTNLASISKSKVAALPVPIPPTDEAQEILRLIDAAFARADRLEAEAARARALLDRLESSILAKAFRGELVPQDPSDEPAQVLLDRIRAERAAAPKAKRTRRAKEGTEA